MNITNIKTGLTDEEEEKNRQEYGKNIIFKTKTEGFFKKFLESLNLYFAVDYFSFSKREKIFTTKSEKVLKQKSKKKKKKNENENDF